MEVLNKRAAMLKVLAHPHRLCIVKGLKNNRCNVSTIQERLGIGQSAVSQHLTKLKACGVVRGVRKGREICYDVIDPLALEIVELLTEDINLCHILSATKDKA